MTVLQTGALPLGYHALLNFNDSNGNRTRVTAVKGRCLNRLTMEPFAVRLTSSASLFIASYEKTPRVGLEPTTTRLTAECSTIELSRKVSLLRKSTEDLSYCTLKTEHESLIFKTFFSSYLWLSLRPISKCQLNTLLCLHLIPIYLVVFKGSYLLGYLILRGASRLDAFSVYPVRTWLPCHGPGRPTGTPAVRPSRSSRTKDSSSQISYACAG